MMDFSQLSHTKRNVFLLLGQIILLVICVSYIEYVYLTNILPDKIVNNTFEQVQCVLSDKKLEKRGTTIPRYRADFLITYSVNGKPYNTWVSGNGLERSFTMDRGSQQNMLNQFDVGQTYPCWHNPESPQIAVLVLRSNWSSTFKLFIPSIILLIVIYYLSRTISHLFRIKKT